MRIVKQPLLVSLICVLTAIMAMGIIVSLSRNINGSENGFVRRFLIQQPLLIYQINKPSGVRFISGFQNNAIYFDTDTAGLIFQTDTLLARNHFIRLNYPFTERIQSLYSIFTDSIHTYIMAGNVPLIIRFDNTDSSIRYWQIPANLYSESIVIDSNNFAFRMFEKVNSKWQQVFVKVNPLNQTTVKEDNISPKKNDAGFSTDGHLVYDKDMHRIIYVEYYHNVFLCMDTSLHLIYSGHTIDTFRSITVQAGLKKSAGFETITNSTPLRPVNLQSCIYEKKLYIHSYIKADNETPSKFKDNSVIDVYNITSGQYFYSFYIPSHHGGHLVDFKVARHKIIVVYNDVLSIYLTPLFN